MKRKGNLYPIVCEYETILRAIQLASKGKRRRRDVRHVLQNKESFARRLQAMLKEERFVPSDYQTERVIEGSCNKQRDIFKPRFYPDQVVHWCIYLAIRDWIYSGFYEFSCGSIPGRGVHYGKKYVERWIRENHKNTKYYLKMDVTKFYPSIKSDRLMHKLRRRIKDERLLRLIDAILRKSDGLPIGMLLSQVFANFFITDIDHAIKQEFGAIHYLRYMDDMVVFGRSKKQLHQIRRQIESRLADNGLRLKGNWQVNRFDAEPLDFMGFRFYRDHTTLRRSIMLRITRRVKKVYRKGRAATPQDASAVISYLGWIKHSDSYGLFKARIKPYLRLGTMKNIIRRNQENGQIQEQQHRQTARMGQDQQSHENLSSRQHRRSACDGRQSRDVHL